MLPPNLLIMLVLSMPLTASAGITVYTDKQSPPANLTADTTVVYLDAPDTLQNDMSGALSSDPAEAERQARALIRSEHWQAAQSRLVASWRGLLQAWQLGLAKYPAVVFDDAEVVYGTADVAKAQSLRPQERRP